MPDGALGCVGDRQLAGGRLYSIMSGKFAPGARLSERELRETLGLLISQEPGNPAGKVSVGLPSSTARLIGPDVLSAV